MLLCACICGASVLFSVSGASFSAQSPRIVETVYPTRDIVVADIVLTEPPYSADNTGRTDCAAVLQRAIDDCFAAGGTTKLRLYDRLTVELTYHEFTRFKNIRPSERTAADLKTYFLQPLYAIYEWIGRAVTNRTQKD